MTDLVALVETMREVQAAINMYDGPLAHYHSAWGDLKSAMWRTLAEHYRTQGHYIAHAEAFAERVIDEVYDNGENIAYNMRLLADGEIELRDAPAVPCGCEHRSHMNDESDEHPYLGAPAGPHLAPFVGVVCTQCARGHLARFFMRSGTHE